ncbi:MAG: M28 family peptidase [Acidobacteriota bacterium]|nr:MAG: M28 family peptidase [Acidobacteriota bacterium]
MRKRMRAIRVLVLLSILISAAGLVAAAEDAAGEEALLSNVRQLTFEGLRAGEGYFSADGTRITFQSERDPANPFFQIYLMDLETGDTQRVSPGSGKTTCSWVHPGGKKVLFASTHKDPDALKKQKDELDFRASGQERRYSWDYDEYYDLFEAELDGGAIHQLTTEKGYDAEGSWSPDGRLIAFASNRHAYSDSLSEKDARLFETDKSYFMEIYIMNADGSNVRRLTNVPGYDGGPFFSADGAKICWRRFSEDGLTAEIFTMNLDGSDQKQLTHLGAMSWAPFFHPSGEYLIFATNKHGFANFELYMVDSAGQKEPVRVTYTEGFDGLPTFTPDGNRLAWTSNRTSSKQSQIFLANWNQDAARELMGLGTVLATDPSVSAEDLRTHVATLASEEMEGRLTGTEGAKKAAAYGIRIFEALGLEPAGEDSTFLQPFEFTAGVSLGSENRLAVKGEGAAPEDWQIDVDWRPLAYSRGGDLGSSEVVFAGYGIVAPTEGDHEGYDSYVHLDVEDKWVMVFRYMPEEISPERRQHLSRYSGIRYKAMAARERGAKGLLVVSGPNSQVENQLVPLSFDASSATTSLGVLSISDALAQSLLSADGKELQALQDELDSGELSMGFAISNRSLEVAVDIAYETKVGNNVLARLRSGSDEAPVVVVGAHYDHLGRGVGMSTLAREDEREQVHYGADDNASGVSGLLEMAEYLVSLKDEGRLPLKRDIIFALWSGEELGLLGSNEFARKIGKEIGNEADISSRVAAYLNMDMIGRLNNELILQGIGSSSVWTSEIEKRNAPIGLAVVTQNDSYLPTDSTSFYLKRVPVLAAFTGTHEEYHSPRDTADTLNYDGMEKVARLMSLITRSVAIAETVPDYKEMKRPTESGGRARLRAYLGTIPDYAQGDVVGVSISGVIGGGPAEAAGLAGGDVIVELAGRKIENIYDYTYAIEALKIGQTIKIVVQRNGELLTLDITPGSRE